MLGFSVSLSIFVIQGMLKFSGEAGILSKCFLCAV